jgi:hypothetical protein
MNNMAEFLTRPEFYIPFLLWSIVWKGLALWKAAGKRQLIWFILLLTVNTLSLFEIIYIFFLNRFDIDKGRLLSFLEKSFKGKK